jgi:hypothetical protein
MNKKVVSLIALAILAYGVFVYLVLNFYNDSPTKMKWEDRQTYNQQYVNKISLDKLTFEQIIQDLGSPDITEAKKVGDDYYQLLFYRTQHVKSDGITTEDECTPLLFKNGVVIAIGLTAKQSYQAAIQ